MKFRISNKLFYFSIITLLSLLNIKDVKSQSTREVDSLVNRLTIVNSSEDKVNVLIELGALLLYSEPEKSFEYLSQALSVSKEIDYKLGIGKAYHNFGSYYYDKGEFQLSHKNFDLAIEIFSKLKNNKSLGLCYNALGLLNMAEGNYDLAKNNFQTSLDHLNKLDDKTEMYRVYLSIGNLNFYQSNFPETLKYYKMSLEIAKEINDQQSVAMCLSNIGNVLASQGDYSEALDYYLKAIEKFEYVNDQMGFAGCLNNIGLVHYLLGDLNKTVQYFYESIEIYTKLDYEIGIINNYVNIGKVNIEQENYEDAEKNLFKALTIAKKNNDKYNIAISYVNLGEIYYQTKDLKRSREYYVSALEINSEVNDAQIEVNCFQQLAKIELENGNMKNAERFALEGLKIAKEINTKDRIRDSYETLSAIYEKLGKKDLALDYYKIFKTMHDSIFNETNSAQINELETKFQTQRKQQQIELQELKLSQQSVELEKEKLLKKTLAGGVIAFLLLFIFVSYAYSIKRKSNIKINLQKEKIERQAEYLKDANVVLQQQALSAQMNPHFMYNSLNSVQSYILRNDRLTSSEYLSKFSNLMRKVLENSQSSLITLHEEFEALNLYIDMELIRFKNSFNYTLDIMDGIDLKKHKIPPLILQPFVENAIHHGLRNKEGNKKLKIDVGEKEDFVFIIIEDNGIGREEAQKIKQNKLHTYKSYGTKITANRIDLFKESDKTKLNHKLIDLKSDKGESTGTRVEIEIY